MADSNSPTKTRPGDQQLPSGGRECVQDALIAFIEERKQLGIQRYGSPLMTHNGRDSVRDATEEALDLTLYLMQVAMEMRDLRAELREMQARAEHAEGELSSLRDHRARWQTEHERAEQLAAAIADVRRLQEMTIASSCRMYAIEQAEDTLAVLDRALAVTGRIADEEPIGVHAFEQNPAATQVSVCICGLWRDHHVHGADPCACDACRTPGDAEAATAEEGGR